MPAADQPRGQNAKPQAPVRYRPPSARQSVAAAQAFVSQGKAVEKTANTQKAAVRTRQAQVKDTKSAADLARTKQAPKQFAKVATLPTVQQRAQRQAAALAPVLTVLNQTTRPLHGIAGGADALVQGKGLSAAHHAFTRGIENKDHITFSKVLQDAGAPKVAQRVGGFALDVAADPTTYTTFGLGGVVKKGAQTAVEDAAKGLTVKVAGHELPGVRAATGKTLGKAAQKVATSGPAKGVKALVRDVNPNIAPEGVSKQTWAEATSAARTARATVGRHVHDTHQQAVAVRKALGRSDKIVHDAIERGQVNQLPEHLQAPARFLDEQYRHINALEKQHGIQTGTRTSYVPHYTAQSLAERAPSETRGAVGKRVIKPGHTKARTREGTLADLRQSHPGQYNEDAALAYANRLSAGHKAVTQAQLNQRLVKLGRPFKAGEVEPHPETEAVFRQHGSDLSQVTDKKLLDKIAANGAPAGEHYVILNKDVVAHAHAISNPGGGRSALGRKFDKVQGAFKFIATQPNPGFHIRNFVGDTQNAYLAQSGHRLPGNMAHSAQTLRALKKTEEAQRTLGAVPKEVKLGRGVKIDGKRMSYADLAQEAANVGAIRAGFTNRELHDLLKPNEATAKVKQGNRIGRAVKRTAQSREDLPRLGTYIEGRRMGMSAEEAARFSAKYHFDYANLTEFERRVARRAMPFYTFSSRNIPLQAKTVLQKPGKYAAYQKLRENAAQAAGLQPGWEKDQSTWEQRNAGVPIKIGGKVHSVSAGLPLQDLNEFPTTTNPAKLGTEYLNRAASLTSPIIKDPIEIWANYSAFFRDKIKQPNAPLVAAPSFVGSFPDWAKKKFGVTKIVDKKTGKKVWAWDSYANYVAHAIPGPPAQAMGLLSGTDRSGRATTEKVVSALGFKTTPLDPLTTAINAKYSDLGKVQQQLGALSQQGIKRQTATAERDRLNAQARQIEQQIYQLKQKRGDKVLPTTGAPRRGRAVSNGLGGGLGGGIGP